MSTTNNKLILEESQVKAFFGLTAVKRAITIENNANIKQFGHSAKLSVLVVGVLEKINSAEGKKLLKEKGFIGNSEQKYQMVFGWGKSNVTKYKNMGTHQINFPDSIEEYKQAIADFKEEWAINCAFSIQGYNYYMSHDLTLKETNDLNNQDTIDNGTEETEETEETESEASTSMVSITIKLDDLTTISMFEKDGQFVSSSSASAIANALSKLATTVATQGVVTASEMA
jgi:phosphotransferase system IIB component